jgi:glycosyltransferase involved in cell wall biosynthesis
MKIAFDCQIFTIQKYGGISRYFAETAGHMLKQNEDIAIFSPIYQNRYLEGLPRRAIKGRLFDRFPPKSTRAILAYNKWASRRLITAWQPDVVHETYFSPESAVPSGVAPVVLTVYDMIHELYADEFGPSDNTSRFKRAAVGRADHVICISHNTKSDLIDRFGTDPSKISVVHLGVQPVLAPDPATLAALDNKKPYFLYVGTRRGYKNFSGLLDAYAQSDRLRSSFDIIAFGGGAFDNSELQELTAHGFNPGQVRQIDGGDNQLAALYQRAAALVYPSKYEGFGLPPIEAMAMQCPVLSSDSSSMPEVIGDAGCYFDANSRDSIIYAMETLVESPTKIASLKKAGFERHKVFTWAKCADDTRAVYKQMVG